MNLVFLYGGNSLESDISEVTYKKISILLKNSQHNIIGIYLNHQGEFLFKHKRGRFVKKDDTYFFQCGLKKYFFDLVIPLVHGKGSEDGTIGAYFDALKIPCAYSGILNSAILQDKITFKNLLALERIPQVDFVYLTYEEYMDISFDLKTKVKNLSYPLIVKPNSLGSSIGVKKVNNENELIIALDKAFSFDQKVLIENAVLNLKEVNVAILGDKNSYTISELETVSNKEEVLSYFDKYLQSKDKTLRIIPSDIDKELKDKIIKISSTVFKNLDCSYVVRFDFLIDQKTKEVYLNEANTIPGSLAYYLFEPIGININDLINNLINTYYRKKNQDVRLIHDYHEGNKKALLSKE